MNNLQNTQNEFPIIETNEEIEKLAIADIASETKDVSTLGEIAKFSSLKENRKEEKKAKEENKITEENVNKSKLGKDEISFFNLFKPFLLSVYKTKKPSNGESLEGTKYSLLFDCMNKNNFSFSKFGAKSNCERKDFPRHIEGKTTLLNDGKIYQFLKDNSDMKLKTKNGYIHYQQNLFHYFKAKDVLTREEEIANLKIEKVESTKTEIETIKGETK